MSGSGEPWRLGVAGLSDLLARRAVSPVELLELFLARIERINPAINAIVAIDGEARAAAAESERRWAAGEPRSALEGIPLTVKDNIPVRGLPTTWGSRMFRDVVPTRDELPVARLRAAGAVILGKTNCPEFTLEGYTDNPLFGVTRNPWDIELTPGGSSGGAVASVAAGLVPAAIGTDGGGSIRRPASHTGLVGLKPSTGLVARDHGLPQVLLDFEAVGPMARRVADVHLLLEVMAGPDRRDRKSLCAAPAAPPPDPVRLLYVPTFGDNPLDRGKLRHRRAGFRRVGLRGGGRPAAF
jgi:aspartyl-tRNA(Asn)/glutamyl-tRNA(Gln) amidotransferase subunit A